MVLETVSARLVKLAFLERKLELQAIPLASNVLVALIQRVAPHFAHFAFLEHLLEVKPVHSVYRVHQEHILLPLVLAHVLDAQVVPIHQRVVAQLVSTVHLEHILVPLEQIVVQRVFLVMLAMLHKIWEVQAVPHVQQVLFQFKVQAHVLNAQLEATH